MSCSSADTNEEVVVETTQQTTTTTITESDATTTTEAVISYEFDIERMSPLTGKEIPPELWLNRPKRVLAFKIDNNINARPQSGLQEADSVFEILDFIIFSKAKSFSEALSLNLRPLLVKHI